MYEETMKELENMAACHRQVLLEAVNGNSEVIWINLCNLYAFRGREAELKECCWKYIRTHQEGVSK